MKKGILLVAFVFGITCFTAAQSTPNVSKRQINQSQRIGEGVASGELTRHETKQLHQQEMEIRQDKTLAKSDGVLTHRERRHIRREQKATSKSIHRHKNDAQKRP